MSFVAKRVSTQQKEERHPLNERLMSQHEGLRNGSVESPLASISAIDSILTLINDVEHSDS